MHLNQSNRAVGQYKRNLKDKDGYALLAVSVLDQAVRDIRSLRGHNPRRTFQPGVQTRDSELRDEERKLRHWLESDDSLDGHCFERWASAAGMPRELFERRRAELLLELGKTR